MEKFFSITARFLVTLVLVTCIAVSLFLIVTIVNGQAWAGAPVTLAGYVLFTPLVAVWLTWTMRWEISSQYGLSVGNYILRMYMRILVSVVVIYSLVAFLVFLF